MRPFRTAYRTISAVLWRFSFCMRLARCVSTVDSPRVEQRGDLLVRAPLRQQLEDFLLAVGQQVVGIGQAALLQPPNVVLDEHAR